MKMLYNQILCFKSFAVNYLFIPTWSSHLQLLDLQIDGDLFYSLLHQSIPDTLIRFVCCNGDGNNISNSDGLQTEL